MAPRLTLDRLRIILQAQNPPNRLPDEVIEQLFATREGAFALRRDYAREHKEAEMETIIHLGRRLPPRYRTEISIVENRSPVAPFALLEEDKPDIVAVFVFQP